MYFPKRIPEPKIMEELEMGTFEQVSEENFKRWCIPIIDEVLAKVSSKKLSVLDVACGPGLLSWGFAKQNKNIQVTGIDFSSHAIRMARKRSKGFGNATFSVGSVEKLPYKDGSFDAVVCKDSFHHFSKPELALREMVRVMKPGGLMYIYDLRRDLPQYMLDRAIPPKTVFQKLQYYSTRASYTREEIKKIASKITALKKLKVVTKRVDDTMAKRYAKMGIQIPPLRQSFQARYILTATKR